MKKEYAYQKEREGYSIWTIGLSGSKQDLIAYARTKRDAQRKVDRLYAQDEDSKYEQDRARLLGAKPVSHLARNKVHHATKKSPAELQREIDETLAGLGLPSTHGRESALEYAQRRANATKTAYAISKMGHVMLADSHNKRLMRDDLGGIALIVKPSR